MTINEIYEQTIGIQHEITDLAPGSPELSAVIARIRELQGELERARSVLGPLVPDAKSPRGVVERTGDELADVLASLMRAATAKNDSP